jgi:glycosyltransferase involved in cell wall biosynthesis
LINLSIIIPVKNEALNLKVCLHSIREARSSHLSYEILVIDNGSDDATVSIANDYQTTVHIVPDATVAGLRNLGAEKANGEILAFIDADCTVEPDWFESLTKYLSDDSIKVFGSPPGIPKKSTWVQECWYQIRKKGSEDKPVITVEWLESMNLFVRKNVFVAAKGFDIHLITCEDYDLCIRLKKYGNIICDVRIQAIHHGEAKTLRRFYKKERWRGISNIEGFRQHDFSVAELPSLLFPLVQLLAIIVAAVALMISILGYIPFWWWLLGLILWQAPLLFVAYRKSHADNRIRQTGGIWALLNVYMTARGQSLFMGAAWQ